MKIYQAYIFDFDYTLADASTGIVMCFRHVLEQNGHKGITDEDIKSTIGKTLEHAFSTLTGVTDKEIIICYKNDYVKKADICMTVNTTVFPETFTVLNILKNRGAKIGIVSNKFRYRIMELFGQMFPKGFFDVVVGGEDLTVHKPAPDGLLFAIDQINVDVVNSLYIGDSTIDAEASQAAGMDFFGVLHGATSRAELSKFPHLKIAADLNPLIN